MGKNKSQKSAAAEVKADVQILYKLKPWGPVFRILGEGPFTQKQIEDKGWNFRVLNIRNLLEPVDVRDPE